MKKSISLIIITIFTPINASNFVFIDWGGRLGNNMFQYALAYAISQENNFQIAAAHNNIKSIFNVEYLPIGNITPKHHYYENMKTYEYMPDVLNIKPNTMLHGFFEADKYFIKYRKELIKIFSPIKSVHLPVLNNEKKIIICAHIRMGDYVESFSKDFIKDGTRYYQKQNVSHLVFPILDYNYYIDALNLSFKISSHNPNECELIIISDSPESPAVNTIIKKITERVKNLDVQIFQADMISEFQLMRTSDICITSASTFSWWASWLNNSAIAIISPKYWLNYYLHQPINTHQCLIEPLPRNIEMSLSNQYFIYSKGYYQSE